MSRIAIVTGANKGIGYETVRGLAKTGKFSTVYLTARNPELGAAATEKLNSEENFSTIKFHQLDITEEESISNLANFISANHGGFDVLVQNAGFAFKQAATESFPIQAEETMKINFWGTLNVMKKCVPLAKKGARIVLVSSLVSWRAQIGFTNVPIAREMSLVNRSLSLERLEELANQFVADCKANKNAEIGWPSSAYGTSKLFVNCITRFYAYVNKVQN